MIIILTKTHSTQVSVNPSMFIGIGITLDFRINNVNWGVRVLGIMKCLVGMKTLLTWCENKHFLTYDNLVTVKKTRLYQGCDKAL